jgi:aminoglycoside phosphotransferase (APT) family kinase protein
MHERRLRDLDDLTHGLRGWYAARRGDVEVRVRRPSAGWSNETLLVETLGDPQPELPEQFVVRLPPLIAAFPDHERSFEAQVLTMLASHGVPVPGVELVEHDEQWLGAPFLVMELLHGRPVQEVAAHDPWLMDADEQVQRSVQQQFVEAIGDVHRVTAPDADAPASIRVGLAEELAYWHTYVEWAADGEPSAKLLDLLAWCSGHVPPEPAPVLLWGDARLGNAMYDEATHRLTGLLDWELATFGPPEMDLAWYLQLEELTSFHAGATPPGFRGRDDLLRAYTEHTTHEVAAMDWHTIFALARSAALSDRHARVAERTGEFFPGSYGDDNPLLMVADWQISRWKG